MKDCRKILVVKPSSLGDVVHSFPFLNVLRSCFPKAEIHWVIARGLEGLLEGHPMISRLIVIDKDMWKKISRAGSTLKDVRRLYRELREQRYDLAIDLQGLLRSGLITMATRARVRAGFAEAREGSRLFYSLRVRGGRDLHAVDRYLRIAAALGCDVAEVLFPFSLFGEPEGEAILEKRNCPRYAVIVPGARWNTKIWPAERFARVAAGIPLRSFIVGGASDTGLAEQIVKGSAGRAVSLAGRTGLKELMEIMRDASVVITNDSGPMHIAAGYRIPTVAIFGPTDPVKTGPYGRGHAVLQSSRHCVPCMKRKCATTACMEDITPEVVIEKVLSILAGRGGQA